MYKRILEKLLVHFLNCYYYQLSRMTRQLYTIFSTYTTAYPIKIIYRQQDSKLTCHHSSRETAWINTTLQKNIHYSYVFNQDKVQHPLLSKEDKDVDTNQEYIFSLQLQFPLYIYTILAFAITLEYLSNQFSLSAFTPMHPRFPFPL